MKIYFKRLFKYTLDNRTVHKILPGTYEVPRQVGEEAAKCALELGQAVIVPEPKIEVPEPIIEVSEPIIEDPKPKKRKLRKKAPENKALKVKESK